MHTLHLVKRASAWPQRALQPNLLAVLHTAGAQRPAQQAASSRDAGGHRPAAGRTVASASPVLRRAEPFETPLSSSEIQHGVRAGIIRVM